MRMIHFFTEEFYNKFLQGKWILNKEQIKMIGKIEKLNSEIQKLKEEQKEKLKEENSRYEEAINKNPALNNWGNLQKANNDSVEHLEKKIKIQEQSLDEWNNNLKKHEENLMEIATNLAIFATNNIKNPNTNDFKEKKMQ